MSDVRQVELPFYLNERSADVEFFVFDENVSEFHYAWILEDGQVLRTEFNVANWPRLSIHSFECVTDYVASINPDSFMMEHYHMVRALKSIMGDFGLDVNDENEWILQRYHELYGDRV